MKTIALLLTVSCMLSVSALAQTSPCDDPIYLKLQEKEIEDMSDREYEIFREKSRACTEYLSKRSPNVAPAPAASPAVAPPVQTVVPQVVPVMVESGSYVGTDSYLIGMSDGRALADGRGTGGSAVGGFFGGLFLGLIGTGIAYAAQSKPILSSDQLMLIAERDRQYQVGYREGFQESLHQKKRNAALTGGLIGTAVLVLVVINSY